MMKSVFVVIDDEHNPILVCESRSDASSFVSSTFGKKTFTAQQNHIKELAYIRDSRKYTFSDSELKQLIESSIKIALNIAGVNSDTKPIFKAIPDLDSENFHE